MSLSSAAVPQRIPRRVAPVAPERGDRPRHLRLVDTAARRRERRRRLLLRIWAVGIVAAAFVGVGVHAFIAQGQMSVDTIDSKIARAQAAVGETRLTVAEAQSPAVIVQRAKDLGLTAAPSTRVVTVPETAPPAADASGTRIWQAVKPSLESTP